MKYLYPLKPYIGVDREGGTEEGACLIFAHNTKEAKKIAYPILHGWFEETEWINIGIRLLKGEHYYQEADPAKLAAGIAHVIDDPRTCLGCERWGAEWFDDEKHICANCFTEETI